MKNKKVLVFDMDGVLVEEASSWIAVHRYFGTDNSENLKNYLKKEINYQEFMRRDISSWPEKTHISQIEKIFSSFSAVSHAKETIESLKNKGYKEMGLISAGIDVLANKIGNYLEINHILANGLEIDRQGFLTGNGLCRVDLMRKDKPLNDLSEKLEIPLSDFVAIGDSKYDISMLKAAGLAIAFNPMDKEVRKAADIVVEGRDFRKILDYL